MPFCDDCDRHWTPTSMRADGSCPTCGRVLELRQPLGAGSAGAAAARPADDDPAPVKAPWHFKVLLVALVVYLGWRGVQGVEWLASHI